MVNTKAIACLVALSAMLAACSGGSEGEADASVQAEASAPAAPAGPLAATDMSTVDGTSVANFYVVSRFFCFLAKTSGAGNLYRW